MSQPNNNAIDGKFGFKNRNLSVSLQTGFNHPNQYSTEQTIQQHQKFFAISNIEDLSPSKIAHLEKLNNRKVAYKALIVRTNKIQNRQAIDRMKDKLAGQITESQEKIADLIEQTIYKEILIQRKVNLVDNSIKVL